MAFRTKKISQMDPKGAPLSSTDLLEISELVSGSYVTKSITGQEIIDSVPPTSVEWGDIGGVLSTQIDLQNALNDKQVTLVSGTNIKTINSTSLLGSGNVAVGTVTSVSGTAPIASTGGATPTISIATANTTTTGALTSTDWNTFNGKQSALVSGTNIKTINGTSILGSGDLTILTGITIGTTAITSGTVGRVLFEGTGNVVSESANLFWDNTNGRLGIGGTPSTFTLDVTGTARITSHADGLSFSATGNANTRTSGAGTFIDFQSTYGRLFAYNFGTSTWLPILLGSSRLIMSGSIGTRTENFVGSSASFSGDVKMLSQQNYFGSGENNGIFSPATYSNTNYPAIDSNSIGLMGGISSLSNAVFLIGTKINFQVGTGASSLRAQFAPTTGNFLINTGTDAGYKLDVNGTARVSGNLTLSSSNPLSLTNSSAYFSIGSYFFGSSASLVGGNSSSSDWTIRVGTGGLLIANGTNNNHLLKEGIALFTDNAANTNISGSTSAVLQANSTTKGFLPPRMTTTQKNAISSPAAGLQVFDTTLNQMSYYNGSSWTNI